MSWLAGKGSMFTYQPKDSVTFFHATQFRYNDVLKCHSIQYLFYENAVCLVEVRLL